MANSNNVGIVVHFGGESNRPPIGARRISRRIGYSRLLLTLYQMTGIDSNKYLLKVSVLLCENNESHLIPINNDDDLWFFFDPDTENRYVHIYVVIEELQSDIVSDIPTTNEYHPYASYLRSEDIINSPIVTQGFESIGINEFGAGTSRSNYQDIQYENTCANVENASPDIDPDPLIDSFGAQEFDDSEPDDSGSDSESDEDEVDVSDIQAMYEQHDQGTSSTQQVSVPIPSTQAEYAMHQTISFFNAKYPEILIDSFEIPKKGKFYDSSKGVLEKGMVFKDKKNLQSVVKDFSVRIARREYRVVESTPRLWKVKCKNNMSATRCSWGLRACLKDKLGLWEITKYGGSHTCLMNAVSVDHHNLCKNMIASMLTGMVETDPGFGIKYVQRYVKDKYKFAISYHKAWHGLKRARENVYGTWESSVIKLPKFMGALQKWNPGTIVQWHHSDCEIGGAKMLKYVFWAFQPCIDGFRHCRKIICVDGTHLYTKYKHKMLIAVCMDGNQNLLPLAYAIVDEETFASWRWFLHMLSTHVIKGAERTCLISDRHVGLIAAVERIPDFQPPQGVHRFCLRHVCSNFNNRFKNIKLKDLCWQAGEASTIRQFDNVMQQIKDLNEDAYLYLENIEKSQWTLAHDEGWRCGVMTTNLAECMNGVLKGARRLPICAIVQITFHRSATYFLNRLESGRAMLERNQPWPDEVLKKYQLWQNSGMDHEIYKFDYAEQSASVKTYRPGSSRCYTHIVKLQQRECTCGKWRHNGIPCSHAMQTCRYFGVDPAVYMTSYYSTNSYVNTYNGRFEPLPDEYYWDEPMFQLCHNPSLRVRRRRGRDITTRIPNEMDWPQARARQQYRAQQATSSQPGTSARRR